MEGRFTQQELAERMGVSQPTVQRWLSGSMPRGKRLSRLAETLGVTVKGLFAEKQEAEPTPVVDQLQDARASAIDEVAEALGQIKEHIKRIERKMQELRK